MLLNANYLRLLHYVVTLPVTLQYDFITNVVELPEVQINYWPHYARFEISFSQQAERSTVIIEVARIFAARLCFHLKI